MMSTKIYRKRTGDKTDRINVCISPELKSLIYRISYKHDMKMSELARIALDDFLRRYSNGILPHSIREK